MFNHTNITDIAAKSFASLPDARSRELVQKLVAALHGYARDMQLTHKEWRGALAFLHDYAKISSKSRSEFSLLFDVFGLSSLVDLIRQYRLAAGHSFNPQWKS